MAESIGKETSTDGSPSEELKTASPTSGGNLEARTSINEKALLRKLDFRLLPPLTLLYLLSFLDRSNGKFNIFPEVMIRIGIDSTDERCSLSSSRQCSVRRTRRRCQYEYVGGFSVPD